MKRKIECNEADVITVDAQPGDGTRYQYMIIQEVDYNRFHVIPANGSTIVYPSLNAWEVHDYYEAIKDRTDVREQAGILATVATIHKCNPHTLREVVLGIMEAMDNG